MENNNIYDYSELIDLLLDGEINSTEQKILYDELAKNEALQAELNSAMKMKNAIEFEKLNSIPSAALKSALFTNAGLDIASVGATVATSTAVSSSSAIGIGSYLSGLGIATIASISSLLSIAIFSLTLYFTDNLNFSDKSSEVIAVKSLENNTNKKDNLDLNYNSISGNNQIQDSAIISQLKQVKSFQSKYEENSRKINNLAINEYNKDLKEIKQSVEIKNTYNNHLTLEQSLINEVIAEKIDFHSADLQNINNESKRNDSEEKFLSLSDFAFSILGTHNIKNFPNRSFEKSSSLFNNFGLELAYKFDIQQKLLMTISNEELPIYEVQNDELIPVTNIWWVGLGYQLNIKDLEFLNSFTPMIQANLGASKYGMFAKSILGIEFLSENNLSLLLGIDASAMSYQYQNATDVTGKIGLIYKLTYNF